MSYSSILRRGLQLPLFRALPAHRVAVRTMAQSPTYHALLYTYVPDILEKRGPHREEHLANARRKVDESKMVIAGAYAEPVDGALFIWKDADTEEIEAFVAGDPYVKNGLVSKWTIRKYMVPEGLHSAR